ncbi:autotransporter-associated N-terminal domain-containing protein [Fusobacterium polymorphum]|uniref:autotransporter-associated N-terminal domain-containing protein n=2 Tax=Fusobacterium nucleatum subsp. polymorphum TaxID=76857 RepID=UPI0030CD3211
MGNNNLYKVENTLRSIAKRYKSVKYSLGLAILFLMMGVSAFSEEVVAQEAVAQQEVMTTEQIASSKDNLKDSIGGLKSKIDTARAENEKSLAGLRLELIQLMEQGNQVVKSPWASWQFGVNYIYNDWQSTYKGRGDKFGKYPFEGIFTRGNTYERSTSPLSKRYSSIGTGSNETSASSSNRNGIAAGYGLVRVGEVQEPIVGFDVSAGVRPKQVVKGTISIADKNPTTPEQPEAIGFNTPTINIAPPAAVTVTAATPTVTAPTVTAPSPNIPNLPTALSFSPVTPTVTAPTAPTVSLFDPVRLNFVATGYGQPSSTFFDPNGGNAIANNYKEYDTGGTTFKINTVSGVPSWSGTLIGKDDGGVSSTLTSPHSATGKIYSFFNDTQGRDVIHKGNYEMSRDDGASYNPTVMFISMNPYSQSSSGPRTYDFQGTVDLIGHNNPSSANVLVGMEHQLLGNNGVSILKNSGTINLKSGNNVIGMIIDTEGPHSKNETINDGTINISSERSIGIDYGYYVTTPPTTDVKLGNINVNGSNNYGFRMRYYGDKPNGGNYYNFTNITGGNGTITVGGTNNIGVSVAQGTSSGDPLSKVTSLNIKVGGTNNIGFYRNSDSLPAGLNTGAMTLNSSRLGSTFNFDSTATGSALIRSDIHEVILDKDITVGATGVKNALMQAGNEGKVTLASGKKITSTTAAEFYGMTAGSFTGTADGKKAIAKNNGELNIGGNKSLGMAIDVDDEGINNDKINFSGTLGSGVYNTGTFTSNSGSEINISGQNSIGAFNGGTNGNLTIANGAKIQGTADNTTGIYGTDGTATNNGTITMTADSVKGLVAGGANANVVNNKTVTVTGKGAVGAASLEGTITAAAGSITADGTSGIALYTGGTVGGTINATGGDIDAKNGAINVYSDKGTINFKGATINTAANSLTFMKGANGGIVDFVNPTTANIATNGTVFYMAPSVSPAPTVPTYGTFTGLSASDVASFHNLNNLTLNMSKDSNIAVASYVESDLSNLGGTSIASLGFHLSGSPDYKTYLLYKSKLTADSGTTYADFKKIALSNSTIINDTTLSTSDNNVNLMTQENIETNKDWVQLINNKTIELTGTNSLAMYASNGKIKNSAGANITIGDTGTAIYGKNKGAGDTDIENSGEITVGQGSTAIYAEDYTTTGLENKGTITLAGDNGIGMSYKPNLTSATTFENAGKILSTASKATGMFASKDKNSVQYTTLNSDTISLGANGVGMYTDASSTGTNPLTNTGKITVGDTGIGMYGYEEDTTGEITAGNSGIGIYSQGGAVNIGGSSTTPKITVGDANATAVFTTGSAQVVTSTDATYNIGANSYGFVNTGSGNTLNISGGTATLTDNGVFVYSSDTTGNITSDTKITSTGSTGSNFGIFSAGTVDNKGDITFTNGTGNVGVYAINNGNITNSGNITLGASTSSSRSIGAIANVGTVNNTGKITVNGQYGIGTYSSGSGSTINNTGDITLTGDDTIGAYGANASNINLLAGKLSLTGNKSTGYYLEAGTGSTIASGTKIDVTGNEANGVYANNGSSLTYDGDTTVDGDAAYGLIVDGGSNVNVTGGTLTVKGTSGINGTSSAANTSRGSAALVVTSGSNLTGGLDVTADVAGDNSVGVYSAGSLAMNSANISAYDSGVNFFTDGGTISVGNNGGTSTVVAGTGANKGSLLFYTPSGNILLNGPVNATVEGGTKAATRATAFYYTGGGTLGSLGTYTQLNPTNVATWARNSFGNGSTSTLGNLNLTMNQDSRLFLTEKVNMDLSNTSVSNLFSGLSASERPNITGAGSYRTFMLYHSHLNVDQAVDLDNANDEYNLMEISSSSITNNNTITGTKTGQIGMAQENDTTLKAAVTLANNGTINLSGSNSAGIYAKNAVIDNANAITVGNSSSGIYSLNNTEISNTGSITTGGSSTGIYYSDIERDNAGNVTAINNTTTGLKNDGSITLNGDDSVGLTYEPGNITGTASLENAATGSITSTGDKNVGMFAKLAQNSVSYNTVNKGAITLGNSASMSNPNVAMYTNASSVGTNPLENIGNITVGDNSVGMYGFEEDNTGNITVGNGSIGLYSKNGNVNVSGSITTGSSNESVGVYTVGSGQTITSTGTTFNLGDTSFGFVNVGTGNNITSTGGSATLSNNGVYIYSNDKANTITNSTNITSTGTTGKNYGIYSSSQANNSGNIDFSNGVGNLGMYMVNGGTGRNSGTITVGASDVSNELFSVGMAAGYIGDKTTAATTGAIENNGTINVNGEYSIGMYGAQSGTTVTNNKDIVLNASNTTGIYVENNAKAVNNGSIRTGASGLSNVTGVVLGPGSTLTNNGTINISGTASKGALLKGGTIANYGSITVSGAGSKETDSLNSTPTTKVLGTITINAPAGATSATITANGVTVTPTVVKTAARNPITVSANSIGLYVNTSGKDYTKSITGLGNLTSEADLIIGTEASQSTTSKYIQVNDNKILDPYNNAILSSGVSKWDIYSGSLTWITTPTLDPGTGKLTNLYMAKVPYTEWAKDKDTFNFTDGLEQRYGVEKLGSRENQVFQKLNTIGNNEAVLLYQAYDEMMGHQYANVQQRINATGNVLDKEFDYLRSEWQTATKSSNKVKTFGTRGEYKTDTAGVIDYKYNGYGVAYVHENEDIKLGKGIGWYTGIVQNTLKFKDIGKSKEEQLQAKVGIFKSVPFDDNNSLNWTISGDIFAGYNKMNRKYLVVDEIFSAKSKYYNYGVSIKNEIGKEFRLSEGFSLRPYAALDLEYGRVSKIREKSGEIKLDVKQNDYISVKPEVGTELVFKHYFGTKSVRVGLGAAYENELGKVANGKNKARVANTNADWFNIRGEKEDRRGNVKFDLNLGLDNQRFGVTGNVGYDTKGQNVRGGLGLRVIF